MSLARKIFVICARTPSFAAALVCAFGAAQPAWSQTAARLEKIDVVGLAKDQVELRLQMSDRAPQPVEFTVDNPARIVLDLPDTAVALASRRIDVKRGALDTVTVAEAGGRTRVQLNLDNPVFYETRIQGNVIFVTVGSARVGASVAASKSEGRSVAETGRSGAAAAREPRTVKNVDFRRGSDGSGRIIIELSDARIPADLRQEGNKVLVTFAKTALADSQMKRLDVLDFATPVSAIDVVRAPDGARLVIAATGEWEQLAYQSDNVYTIEIKPTVKTAEIQDKKEYVGERLNLNFQDIETRAVLQLLADTAGMNMVINESVRGNVTLRLQDVPWDQALDVVLRTKGLDMRRDGNVVIVAPTQELAARDKERLAARKEINDISPVRIEYRQVNYAKAADLAALIKSGKGGSLLSDRGNVSIDERTNTLLLQDTVERLTDIRRLVSTLDIPVRQVQIEARIAIVNDNFSRELGVRWGYSNVNTLGNNYIYTTTGSAPGVESTIGSVITALNSTAVPPPPVNLQLGANAYMVNLPVASPAGRVAMAVLGSNWVADLELSAAESEGRGEIISSPRVITANQKEATIEQGVEIPYQQSASSGATTVSFKKAVLSLKVTPQITPDNRVILDLTVNKDSIGQNVPVGGGGFVPSIDTRQIITQVLVNDGQTVVLGGILETEKIDSTSKVPVLGDVPLLGYLFRNTRNTNQKKELLIFVTPKVIREGV